MADLGLLGGLAGLGEGFLKGMQSAEDRKYKRMEFEAKLKAQENEVQKNEFNKRLEARKAGFLVPAASEDFDPGLLQQDPNFFKGRSRGRRLETLDDGTTVVSDAGAPVKGDPYGAKKTAAEKAKIDLDIKKSGAAFESLPEHQKIIYKKTAEDVAAKKNIGRYMGTALAQLKDPNVTPELKLLAGRELLKTLNSVQGADAIGAEEAKRLGSLLEYKILPRVGEPGKAFGRDLDLFASQVENNKSRLDQTAAAAEQELEAMLGGIKPKGAGLVQAQPSGGLRPEDQEAIAWAKQNPKDARAIQILKANGL